jgi:hypothetical protein
MRLPPVENDAFLQIHVLNMSKTKTIVKLHLSQVQLTLTEVTTTYVL